MTYSIRTALWGSVAAAIMLSACASSPVEKTAYASDYCTSLAEQLRTTSLSGPNSLLLTNEDSTITTDSAFDNNLSAQRKRLDALRKELKDNDCD